MRSFGRSTPLARSLVCLATLAALPSCSRPKAPASVTATPTTPQSSRSSKTKQLDADTPVKTASGASFEAAKGWFLTERDDLVTLESPERDLTVTWVAVPSAPSAERAIQTAWKRVQPNFDLPTKQVAHPPAKDGWDAVTQIVYEANGAEPHTVIALAQQKGTTQYVALVDGSDAAFDRRTAQLMTAISTFRAPGVEEESLAGRTAHRLDADRAKLFEAFVVEALAKAQIPGAAVAVVQDGKVVFEKGFGVRELGKKEAVTPNTLFMIGSTTKSLTTLMMAKLVDERRFDWDTPVTDLWPTFALADAELSKKVLVRHTVCACAGMPRQDMEFLFENATATPESRIEAMRGMKPTTGFGETFQYSNSMVAAGGYVAAHALEPKKGLGPAYDAAMKSRVFDPLGMKSTTLDIAVAERREHASPHGENLRGEYQPMRPSEENFVVAVRPAGAAWSNTRDMSKYVMLELAKGRDANGKELVSEANLVERRQPQIKITDKLAYGLGLFVENDHGVPIVHHGGNTLGFTSDVFVLPEHGVGAVVLTNAAGAGAFRRVVRRRLIELLFDAEDTSGKSLDFSISRRREELDKERAKIAMTPATDWAKAFTGTYKNDGLGAVTIRAEKNALTLDAGEWKSAVGTKKEADGTTKFVLLDPPAAGMEFVVSKDGGERTLTLNADQHAYVFAFQKPGAR